MTALVIALAGSYGVFLLVTAGLFGWTGVAPGPHLRAGPAARKDGTGPAARWDGAGRASRRYGRGLRSPGLPPSAPWRRAIGWAVATPLLELATASAVAFSLTAASIVAVFGAVLPALAVGAAAACWPAAAARARRDRRRRTASEAWPRLLEEVSLLAGSLGSSVPQALFEVGRAGPVELRPAFDAAHRHWLMSTDLPASLGVLTAELADPTADAACETLLVAHEVGGHDLPRRLAALVEDRICDLEGRRDAAARQSGARFARRFVLLVPVGMALAGLAIGDGRAAYASLGGQLAALLGVGLVAACWIWSGRIMDLPAEERVFGV